MRHFVNGKNANATTRKTYGIPHTSILKNQHFHLYFLSYRQRRFAFGGRETVQLLLTGMPILSKFIAAGVGLIPSCYPSVLLTQLYLDNAITLGTMLAGTLSNAGLGYLVLYRVNPNRKENLRILALLYGLGVVFGIVAEILL